MDRSVAKTKSRSVGSVSPMLFTQSLLGGFKRVIGFFVMSEVELSQAGIVTSVSHLKYTEKQTNLQVEKNGHGRYF